jgi:hypothetical protein
LITTWLAVPEANLVLAIAAATAISALTILVAKFNLEYAIAAEFEICAFAIPRSATLTPVPD